MAKICCPNSATCRAAYRPEACPDNRCCCVTSIARLYPGAVLPPCRVQLQWPKAAGEARRAQAANEAMLRAWVADTDGAVLTSLTVHTAAQVWLSTPIQRSLTLIWYAAWTASKFWLCSHHAEHGLAALPSSNFL